MPRLAHRILILDPPRGELAALAAAFRSAGNGEVEVVHSARELIESVEAGRADLIVVDESLGDGEKGGLALLRELRALDPELPIVAAAESGDVARVARAVEAGASD